MTKENEFDSIMIILKDISDRLKEVEVVFPSSVLPSRCYGNPPSPEGEGLTGHGHVVISSVSREIPRVRNVARAPAPAYLPSVAHRREIPRVRNVNNRTHLPEYTPAVARRHTRAPRPAAYYRKNTAARKNGSLIQVTVSLFLIRCGRRRLRGAPERRGERITRRPRSSLPF